MCWGVLAVCMQNSSLSSQTYNLNLQTAQTHNGVLVFCIVQLYATASCHCCRLSCSTCIQPSRHTVWGTASAFAPWHNQHSAGHADQRQQRFSRPRGCLMAVSSRLPRHCKFMLGLLACAPAHDCLLGAAHTGLCAGVSAQSELAPAV